MAAALVTARVVVGNTVYPNPWSWYCGESILAVSVMCRLAAALATATAVIGGAVYTQTSGHGFNVTKIAKGFYHSVLGLLSPDNTNAAVYSFLTAGLGVYSAVLLFGPHEVH